MYFSEDNNDNDSTITTTIRMEEGTITEPNTATADERKDVGLGKTKEDKRIGE